MEMTIEKLRFITKSQLPISLETPIGKRKIHASAISSKPTLKIQSKMLPRICCGKTWRVCWH